MAGGIIQLVARGVQDMFLTSNPQITFFKMVYRRYTNFSTEVIPQYFIDKPNFGKRVTCIVSRTGDLIKNMHLVITLPKIPSFKTESGEDDLITKFAWARKIGFALIKSIELEIGEELVDKHYGDWLNIWNELTVGLQNNIDKMIGNVPILTDLTNGKKSYKVFIPLQFWFNRVAGLALPIVALQYDHIKINLEINDFAHCSIITPTHYIEIEHDLVNFKEFEIIEQNIDGVKSIAKFIYYDIFTKRMYFWRISDTPFKSSSHDVNNSKYIITGHESCFETLPKICATERKYRIHNNCLSNISLGDTFLLVEYIYLDTEERILFTQSQHEYLIEQLQYDGEKTIKSIHKTHKLGFTHSCKELFWVTQLRSALNPRNNDLFNYTDSLIKDTGHNIITDETILFNHLNRLSHRNSQYFNWIQPYQHHSNSPSEGINSYSFALYSEKYQTSGSANFARIDNIGLKLSINPDIVNHCSGNVVLRTYALVYNILKVSNGISKMVFSNDIFI